MEKKYEQNRIVATMMKIGHGNLDLFIEPGLQAAAMDPNFFARMAAWNHEHGKVFDSKKAYPPLSLRRVSAHGEYDLAENAYALMASLDPRNLYKSYQFHVELNRRGYTMPSGHRDMRKYMLEKYLRVREESYGRWSRVAVSHRQALKALYTIAHIKPVGFAQEILFERKYPPNSVFAALRDMKGMSTQEQAGHILNHKIPFPVATGAVSSIKDRDILLALISNMTANELAKNRDTLERHSVFSDPILTQAFEEATEKAKSDKRANVAQVSKAIERAKSPKEKKRLVQMQEEQLDKAAKINGDVLILGDRSGSMSVAIKATQDISAILARQVTGKVFTIFFDSALEHYDFTGKTLEEIKAATSRVRPRGSTWVGGGVNYVRSRGIPVDIIVIVSDGGENVNPYFHEEYPRYVQQYGVEPSVYFLRVPGATDSLSSSLRSAGIVFNYYDIGSGWDDYTLMNIVAAIKPGSYGLVDEILETPLLTFDKVFA